MFFHRLARRVAAPPLGLLGLVLSLAAWLVVALYVAPVLLFARAYWPPRLSGLPFDLGWLVAWTLGQAVASASLAVAIGWPLGIASGFYGCRAARTAVVLGLAPFMSPVVVAALGLRVLYSGTPLGFLAWGWSGVVALNSYFNIGLAASLVDAAARGVEESVLEHARLLGLRGPSLWRRLLLPSTARAAAAAWGLAFLYSATSASPLVVAGAAYRYYTVEAMLYSLYTGFPSLRGAVAALALAELVAAALFAAALLAYTRRLVPAPVTARPRGLPLHGAWRLLAATYAVAVTVYLYAPLAALAAEAASASPGFLAELASGMGPGLLRATVNSIVYASATVAAAVPLGLAVAESRSLSVAALSAVAVAPVAYGVSATIEYFEPLSRLLGPAGASVALILLAHLAAALPLASRALDEARERLGRAVREHMLLTGIRGAGYMRHLLAAQAAAAAAAAGLAAAASLGEFGASIVVSVPETWSLTVLVYNLLEAGRALPEACLAALILEALSLSSITVAYVAAQRLARRGSEPPRP